VIGDAADSKIQGVESWRKGVEHSNSTWMALCNFLPVSWVSENLNIWGTVRNFLSAKA